jgi:serpin B
VELQYKGDDLSMVILLPRKEDGIGDLERALRPDSLANWLGSLKRQEIRLYLPRFRFASDFSLGETLHAMGMWSAFGPEADLSGMDGLRGFWIGAVLHKAFVEANERGTEAAGASAVIMTWGMRKQVYTPPVPTVRADHPFLFLIRDTVTGSVLFLGRVMDPTRA